MSKEKEVNQAPKAVEEAPAEVVKEAPKVVMIKNLKVGKDKTGMTSVLKMGSECPKGKEQDYIKKGYAKKA